MGIFSLGVWLRFDCTCADSMIVQLNGHNEEQYKKSLIIIYLQERTLSIRDPIKFGKQSKRLDYSNR